MLPDTITMHGIVQFGRPMWKVFTGRRDGSVSLASEATRDLPSAAANFTTLQQQFANNGLNVTDLVALSGKMFFFFFVKILFTFYKIGVMDSLTMKICNIHSQI